MHVLEFDVRPTELDSFGHVNNARFLEYLEWARMQWSLERGLSYDRFRELYVIPAVVEVRMRFSHEACLGDRLRVETQAFLAHSAKIVFHQTMLNQDRKRVLKAEVAVVAVDTQTRSFRDFPAELTSVLDNLNGSR